MMWVRRHHSFGFYNKLINASQFKFKWKSDFFSKDSRFLIKVDDLYSSYDNWIENDLRRWGMRQKKRHLFAHRFTSFKQYPQYKKDFKEFLYTDDHIPRKFIKGLKKFFKNTKEPKGVDFFKDFTEYKGQGYFDWFFFNNFYRLNDWNYNVVFSDDFIDSIYLIEDPVNLMQFPDFSGRDEAGVFGDFSYLFQFFYPSYDFIHFYIWPFFSGLFFMLNIFDYFVNTEGYFLTTDEGVYDAILEEGHGGFSLEAQLWFPNDFADITDFFIIDLSVALDSFSVVACLDF
jgi:hypothetical protein